MGGMIYDFVIIGSGFGGSVSALRLSEKGYKVLVIEQGKDYSNNDFARTNWNLKKWLWLPFLRYFGIQKITFLRHISVLSGVGVGGGSLVFAGVLEKPKPTFFKQGSWASLEDWQRELDPFYEKALIMMGGAKTPVMEEADEALLMLAKRKGKETSFSPTTCAIFFGSPGQSVSDPFFNGEGPDRSGCTFCGSCMTGCRVNAKNSLDKNYLYLAIKKGAKVLPETKVTSVMPEGTRGSNGYKIVCKSSTKFTRQKKIIKTRRVIFSGGVMGTVKLLLQLKKTTLPDLSNKVGHLIRTNNEALIMNTTWNGKKQLWKGVAIGSILQLDDNSHVEPVRYGKGSGFWRIMMMPMVTEKRTLPRMLKLLLLPWRSPVKWAKVFFTLDFGRSTAIILFMQHLESTMIFTRSWLGLSSRVKKGKAPTAFIPEAHDVAREYADILGAKSQVAVNETLTGIPSTAHILGGACMGNSAEEGVIDKDNKVFGYDNMYVFDGSMISSNPGVNPSLTIAAITERGVAKIP